MVLYVGTGDKAGGRVEEMQRSGRERREAADNEKGKGAEKKSALTGRNRGCFVDTGGRADI